MECCKGLAPEQECACAKSRIAELEAALGSLWDAAVTVLHENGRRGCFVSEADWRRAMAVHPALANSK